MSATYGPSPAGYSSTASSGAHGARYVPGQTNAPATKPAKQDSPPKKSKRKRAGQDATTESVDRKSKKSKTVEQTTEPASDDETKAGKTKKDKKDRKKKKKSQPEEDEDGNGPQADVTVDADGDVDMTGSQTSEKKKAKREKTKKRTEQPPTESEHESEQNTRHKSVLERKIKSLRLASEAAAKQPAEEPEEEEERHGLEPLPQPAQPQEEEAKLTYDTLPSWLSAPIRVSHSTRSSFTSTGIPAKTAEALQNKGYAEAFAVQTAAIPLLLPNNKDLPGDLLISAATGSGKTLAYALPIVNDISQGVVTRLRALVVLPTRELVRQAQEVFELCAKAYEGGGDRKRVRIGVAVGSQQLKAEQEVLIERESRYDPDTYRRILQESLPAKASSPESAAAAAAAAAAIDDVDDEDRDPRLGPWDGQVTDFASTVDVLLCTPGRLVEHLEQTPGFDLDYVRWLVVDEADKLLAQSFQGWLDTVMARFRRPARYGARDFPDTAHSGVRKVVLSATLTRDLSLLNQLALRRPQLIVLDADDEGAAGVAGGEAQRVAEHTLPERLREFATRVHDADLKPLYLLELLRGGLMTAAEEERPKAAAVAGAESDTADSSSDTSSSDSDSSSDSSADDSDTSSDSDSDTSSSGSDSDSDASAPTPRKKNTARSTSTSTKKPPPPAPAPPPPMALIFTKSNESALRLSRLLTLLDSGFLPASRISTLTSTTPTSRRRRTLRAFSDGSSPLRVIVASDLVARGIDIPGLAHVVNYDLPASLAGYVHRVGRTARAGRAGCAWTLVADGESGWFWGKIAKGGGIRRGGAVGRARVEEMGEDAVREYEGALERLGKEAANERRRR